MTIKEAAEIYDRVTDRMGELKGLKRRVESIFDLFGRNGPVYPLAENDVQMILHIINAQIEELNKMLEKEA